MRLGVLRVMKGLGMEIDKSKARGFLDGISESDKVGIIFHDDLDGFASGMLIYDFLRQKGVKDLEVFPQSIEKNWMKKLLDKLKQKDKILIFDLGPDTFNEDVNDLKDKDILYIDHHQPSSNLPDFILEYRTESEVHVARSVYDLVGKDVSNEKEWLVNLGLMADIGWKFSDNLNLINNYLKKNNLNLEEFRERAYEIGDFLIYFSNDLKKAFGIMKGINSFDDFYKIKEYSEVVRKEVEFWVNNYEKNHESFGKINFYCFKPKFMIKSSVTTIISFKNPKEIFIFGVFDDEEGVRISGRCQSGEYDVPEILKQAIQGLENASAGGHKRACGGYIQKKDLEKFKDNLKVIGERL